LNDIDVLLPQKRNRAPAFIVMLPAEIMGVVISPVRVLNPDRVRNTN
jgi:hypothetical protein